jgi:hypothetical protein
LKKASTSADPSDFIKTSKAAFLKVFKKGITQAAVNGDVSAFGFDKTMDLLESCYVLEELPEPRHEIMYECSCPYFWHYIKCKHSIAMSILNKGVKIPPIYNVTNISESRRVGRPKLAKGGEALSSE